MNNITLSVFDEDEFDAFHGEFAETAQQLTASPDEIMFIDDIVLGVHITFDDVIKLNNEDKVSFKSMIYFINYIQKKATKPNQFYLAYQKQECNLVEQLNEMLRKYQQKGEPISYIIIVYQVDRWVLGMYNLKSTVLDIVDLQKNKTKDEFKKLYEQLLKKTGLQKVSFKTVNYIQQDDKLGDGGQSIINYMYKTIVKEQPFGKITPNEKENFKKKLLWLFYKGEKSQHVDYPLLPSILQYNENELNSLQNNNQNPFLTTYWTGIEVQNSDYDLLQKQGKSNPNMIAFWLSYLYYFDMQSKQPILPFFVVANGNEICEEFELIFKPRRRQGVENERLIIVQFIQNNRWTFSIYHMVKKTLEIIDLQNKNITKDELKNGFDTLLNSLVTYNKPTPTFITQSYTDSTDGTEYVINFLWQYINGMSIEKIKFGFSEKRSLRKKLLWVLLKMQNSPIVSTRSIRSIQLPSKKKITQSQISPEVQNNTPAKNNTGRFGNTKRNESQISKTPSIEDQTPQQKKTFVSSFRSKQQTIQQSPNQSPSMISEQRSEQRSSNFNKKQTQEQSPKSQNSETSIQIAKPASRTFGSKKTILANGLNKGGKSNTSKQQEPILETQRSEEYDEDFTDLFDKNKKNEENQFPQQDQDILSRIQEDLTDYYHQLINDEETDQQNEIQKLQEIFRLNNQIKKYLEQKKQVTLDEVLDNVKYKKNNLTQQSMLYNSSLQNYSTVIHDDQSIMRMINEMLQNENDNETLEGSILKRRNYVLAEIDSMDVSGTHQNYDFPPIKNQSEVQNLNKSISLPSIKQRTASILFQKSNIAAQRYGMKIEIPLMQQFYKDGKMNNLLFNFLLQFFEEKSTHQKKINVLNQYNTKVKLFPTQFYQVLCFNLIHSTFRINYFEANKFTFEYTGQDETIFDIFDWLVVPIVEYPTEYSLVFVNLKRKACYCFLLSSLAMRIRDPLYINPEKNPYMKNVITFLQYEYEVKLKRPRDELGKFGVSFGQANETQNFGYSINYQYSGIYALYIIIHLLKNGNIQEIKIDEYQIQILKKVFHDLVVKIGYNEDDNLFHLLEENQFPF